MLPPIIYKKKKYMAVVLTKLKPTSHLIKKKKSNTEESNQILN